MKLYISGPMTGLPDDNFPAFNAAAATLRAAGHEIINPAELGRGETTHAAYMKRDIPLVLQCEGVVLLEGWTHSRGANLEITVAMNAGMPVYRWDKGELLSLYPTPFQIISITPENS